MPTNIKYRVSVDISSSVDNFVGWRFSTAYAHHNPPKWGVTKGVILWQWICVQTAEDRAKLRIDRYSEVTGDFLLGTMFDPTRITVSKLLTTWCTQLAKLPPNTSISFCWRKLCDTSSACPTIQIYLFVGNWIVKLRPLSKSNLNNKNKLLLLLLWLLTTRVLREQKRSRLGLHAV